MHKSLRATHFLFAIIPALLLAFPLYAFRPALDVPEAGTPYDWVQFNGDAQHSGNNTQEKMVTPANVGHLQRLYGAALSSPADGAPVYLHDVSTASGIKDLVFVTTTAGQIIALDAHAGSVIWSREHPGGSPFTTSSPAIDPNRLYVYTYGLDGAVHKHQAGTGNEVTGGGWPEVATLKGAVEKGSSVLSIATSRSGASFLYVTNGGYPGDAGDYQGHVTVINLADGTQHIFNALCSNRTDVHFVPAPAAPSCSTVQAAIWARVGVVYDVDTDRIYMATGNGIFDPAHYNWGDSVFALNPNGTGVNGRPVDSYTPANHQYLDQADLDLGSTAPAILPTPPNSTVRHLGLQSGKDAQLRLLNLDNLSGQGGPGHTGGEVGPAIGVPQGGEVLTAPAVWINPTDGSTWVFVANGNGIAALQLVVDARGTPSLQLRWQQPSAGTSPIVVNGVLYQGHSYAIQARDPLSGRLLWQNSTIGPIHWSSPIVANGVLYVADKNGKLFAFGLSLPLKVYVPLVAR